MTATSSFQVGEIRRGDHGKHAGNLHCFAGIDRLDPGMGVRAADDLAVGHVGQLDVGRVDRLAGHLVGAVVANRALAENLITLSCRDKARRCETWHGPLIFMRSVCGDVTAVIQSGRAGQPLSFRQRLQFPRRGLDGLDDLVVARAAAEVVGQVETNVVLRGIRVMVE